MTTKTYNVGIYCRLSNDDERDGESVSIENQKLLLQNYVRQRGWNEVDTYIDDGYSGTNFDRPGVKRLIEDAKAKRINVILVKDLSRFGRNYIEFGQYTDYLFPSLGCRFIALNNGIDTESTNGSTDVMCFLNLFNEFYSRDTSKKVKAVKKACAENGKFMGTYPSYGYKRDPADKHHLIIDPDAAEIVRLIYRMFLEGTSKHGIAMYLNEHGVPSPAAYRRMKGLPVSSDADNPMWSARTIHEILTKEIYTGDLVQGRHRVKSYKVHQIEAVPEEDWVRVPNTHEAIIDRATFEKVQSLLKRDTRTSPKGRQVHLFSGFLRCPDCGKALTRSVSGSHVYYACSTYKNRSRTACTMHSIKHNRLEAAVLFAIQQQVHLAVSYSEIVALINTAPVKKCQSRRLDDLIAAKERELAKITRYKQGLYQDWKDGEITRDDYHNMKADYERQTAQLTAVLKNLTEERAELANGVDDEHPALVAFMRYQNIDRLTRDILVELVDHIKVYDNGNISVHFKFTDELRKILEYIDLNNDTAAKVV